MTRRFIGALSAITGIGIVARLWDIGRQALTLDEILMQPTAVHYVRFGVPRPEMALHPNLRNILLYLSGQLLGPTAAGLKGWSLLFGVLIVPLLGLFVWRLTHNSVASLVAATLIAFDPLCIYLSRSALQDGWTPFWALVGLHLMLTVLRSRGGASALGGTVLAGIAFGLGVASKYYVIPIEAACVLFALVSFWRRGLRPLAVWVAVGTILSSLLVFLLTYAPWFAAGHSVPEWFSYQQALLQSISTHDVVELGNHDIRAWAWFVRPFVAWQEMQYAAPLPRIAIAVANPLTWLAVLPAIAFLARAKQHSYRPAQWLFGLFLAAYLPLLAANRFIYVFSAVIVLPFAFALIGLAAAELARRFNGYAVVAYVALAIVVSGALYPGVTGHALDVPYLRQAVIRAAGSDRFIPPVETQLWNR